MAPYLLYLRSFCGAGPSDLHAQITHWRAVLASYKIIGLGGDWIAFALHETSLVQVFDVAGAIVNESSGAVITRGDLVIIFETSAHDIRLSMGEAMCHAEALLSLVQPKEILVDRALAEVESGLLLETETRSVRPDLAAAVVDRQQPFRTNLDLKLEHLESTPIVGRESVLSVLASIAAGGLAIVRSKSGGGRSRILREFMLRYDACILILPVGTGAEPLGCLRHALSRAPGQAATMSPILSEDRNALFDRRGLDIARASELLLAEFVSVRDPAWVLIDDADLIDRATLETIVHAAQVPGCAFAVIATLRDDRPVPEALTTLIDEAKVDLPPLSSSESELLASDRIEKLLQRVAQQTQFAVTVPSTRRKRFAKIIAQLSAGNPLAMLEVLRLGVGSGRMLIEPHRVGFRTLVRPRAEILQDCIVDRFQMLRADRPRESQLVAILSVARGRIPRAITASAFESIAPNAPFESCVDIAQKTGWIESEGEWLSLSTRSLGDSIRGVLLEEERREIHRALYEAMHQSYTALDLSEAAAHAQACGNDLAAAALMVRATAKARPSGLELFLERRGHALEIESDSTPATTESDGLLLTTPSPPPEPIPTIPTPQPDNMLLKLDVQFDTNLPFEEPPIFSQGEVTPLRRALFEGNLDSLERELEHLDPALAKRVSVLIAIAKKNPDEAARLAANLVAEADNVRNRLAFSIALAACKMPVRALEEALVSMCMADRSRDRMGVEAARRLVARLLPTPAP